MRVLVTAGPTREHLDRVRFISSASTGLMGIEVAKAAAAAGHEAVLVLGPTHLAPPEGPRVRVRRVVSARDMLAACLDEWPNCDALVASAAVADRRPAHAHEGKPEKAADATTTLELVKNPDILAELAATKGMRRVIGFALQVEDAEARARAKLAKKNLDAVVLDGPSALGADRADFRLLLADGGSRDFPATSKADLAREIVALLSR
jgi:phosphopantothenoylcysteine decarboxylase/phosphopantothenate--cysteine ligase